jgi:hypothetical protein
MFVWNLGIEVNERPKLSGGLGFRSDRKWVSPVLTRERNGTCTIMRRGSGRSRGRDSRSPLISAWQRGVHVTR